MSEKIFATHDKAHVVSCVAAQIIAAALIGIERPGPPTQRKNETDAFTPTTANDKDLMIEFVIGMSLSALLLRPSTYPMFKPRCRSCKARAVSLQNRNCLSLL